jgi:hypothetical protein
VTAGLSGTVVLKSCALAAQQASCTVAGEVAAVTVEFRIQVRLAAESNLLLCTVDSTFWFCLVSCGCQRSLMPCWHISRDS